MDLTYPFIFHRDDYDAQLGVYQKWIHGDSNQIIDKIYVMAAFQYYDTAMQIYSQSAEYHKYANYLQLSLDGIMKTTPDWWVRLYIDNSVLHPDNKDRHIWESTLKLILKMPRIQLIAVQFPYYYIDGHHRDLLPVMFRYLALFDKNLSIILFRDVDNIYTAQHQYFVDKWIQRGEDICVFMNNKYTRQQIADLVPASGDSSIVLENKHYNIIFGGLWNIRKQQGYAFSKTIWQKMFIYIESYTAFTSTDKYKDSNKFGLQFMYGFDELALSRVAVPIFIDMGLSFYAVPINIYNTNVFRTLFEDSTIRKFLLRVSDKSTIEKVKSIIIDEYWVMTASTAGMAQFSLCILCNIYFGVLMGKSTYLDVSLINNIKTRVMSCPLLMGIGVFTFKNFGGFKWFPDGTPGLSGSEVVDKFLTTGSRITLAEWTAGMDPSLPPPPPEDPPIDNYGI